MAGRLEGAWRVGIRRSGLGEIPGAWVLGFPFGCGVLSRCALLLLGKAWSLTGTVGGSGRVM